MLVVIVVGFLDCPVMKSSGISESAGLKKPAIDESVNSESVISPTDGLKPTKLHQLHS